MKTGGGGLGRINTLGSTLLVVLLMAPLRFWGQTVTPVSALLSTARNDLAFQLKDSEISARQAANIKLPVVNGVSLRTETNRFELIRQEYTIRVSLNGLKEMKSVRNTQQVLLMAAGAQKRVLLHEALTLRYEALLQFKSIQSETKLLNALRDVQDERLVFLRKKAALYSDATDIEDLIKAESDRDETFAKLTEKQGDIATLLQFFEYAAGLPVVPDTSGWVSLQHIREWTQTLLFEPGFSPSIADREADITVSEAEYQAEKAKSQKMFDYVQTRYSDRPGDPFRYDFFVGIGFTLPYRGASQVKMEELKIEKLEAVNDLAVEKAEQNRQLAALKSQIASLFQQYDLAQQQLNQSQALFSFDKGAADPLILLTAAEHLIKRRLKLASLEESIFYGYYKLLDISGLMSSEPLTNYLSPNLEKL